MPPVCPSTSAITGDELTIESVTFHGKETGIYNNKLNDVLEDGGTVFIIFKNNSAQAIEIPKESIRLMSNGSLTPLPELENSSRSVGWCRLWPQNVENNGFLEAGGRMFLSINFSGKNPLFREGDVLKGGIQLTQDHFLAFPEEPLVTPDLRIGSVVPGRDWKSMSLFMRNTGTKDIRLSDVLVNGNLVTNAQIIGADIVAGGVGIIKVPFNGSMKGEINMDIMVFANEGGSDISVGYPLRMLTEAWIPIGTWESKLADQDNTTILEMRNLLIDVYWKAPFSDNQRALYDKFHISSVASANNESQAVARENNPSFMVWQCGEEPELSGIRGSDILQKTMINWAEKNHPTYLNLCENRRYVNFAHINEIICMDHYGIDASTNFTSGWDPDGSGFFYSSLNGLHAVMDMADQLKDNTEPQRMWVWSQLAFDGWNAKPFGNYWQAWAQIGAGAKGLLWFVMKENYTNTNASLVASAKRFTREFSQVRGLCVYSETIKQNDSYNCGSGTSQVNMTVKSPLRVTSPVPASGKANRKLLARALVNEEAILLIVLNNNMTSSSAISSQSGTVELIVPDFIPIEDIWQVTPNGKKAVSNYSITGRTITFNVDVGANWPVQCYVIGKEDNTAPDVPQMPVIVENGLDSIILSWKDVFDNVGVKGYKVYLNDSEIADVDVPYYEINNLSNIAAGPKRFSIKAYDSNGNESQMSPYVESGVFTYDLPGDYDNTAAALIGVKNNASIVDGDEVIINITEDYTSTNNEAIFLQMTKSVKITIQGAGADKTILGPNQARRWLHFSDLSSDGVEFIIKDLTLKGFGYADAKSGGCINLAKPGIRFSFINVNFEDIIGGVGAIVRAVGSNQIVSFDNCSFSNNLTKKASSNPIGLIYKTGGGTLSIKSSTFITNHSDVIDSTDPENPVDPGLRRGGVLDVVGDSATITDVILENNVFVNNLVEPDASRDIIQPTMVIKAQAYSDLTLQMTDNIFIENRRDGSNNDIDILIWNPDSITFTLTGNIANSMYAASFSNNKKSVEIFEPLLLDGIQINADFTYTHQDINFIMDGDLPEIMVDEFGVYYVTYSGASGSVLVGAIDLSAEPDSVAVGDNLQIVADITPSEADNKSVTWSVDDADIATIDSIGLLTGVAVGAVTIGATSVDGSNVTGAMTIIVYGSTSVQENPYKMLNVYPNPSQGEFDVALPAYINRLGYDVYNAIGTKVQSGILSGDKNQVNLLDQPKGMYILKTNGEETMVVKLLVR